MAHVNCPSCGNKTALMCICIVGLGVLVALALSAACPPGEAAAGDRPNAAEGRQAPPSPESQPTSTRPAATSKIKTPADLLASASPAVVRVVVRGENFKVLGVGSGFFVSADGLLVTNHRIIEGGRFATVLLDNGDTLFVEGLAAADPKNDLALLKINASDLPFLSVNTGPVLKVGARVYAIGNPKGVTNTLSEGIIRRLPNADGNPAIIQTAASVNSASSGGPLLTAHGKVIGITSARLASGQGVNCVVSTSKIEKLLRDRGKVKPIISAGGARLNKTETAMLDKAWKAIGEQQWDAAKTALVGLRKTQSSNSFVAFALGYVNAQLGDPGSAVACYKQAVAIKADHAAAHYGLGIAYKNMRRYSEAIAALKQTIALQPNTPSAYFHMGDIHGYMHRYEESIAAFKQAIALDPDYARAYCYMGLTYQDMQRYTEAIAAYKQAIALKPDDADGHLGLGSAYADLGRYSEAIAAYKQGLVLKPGQAKAHYGIGLVYARTQRYPEAIAAFKQAIALKPDHAKAYYGMGTVYGHTQRYPEAIAAFKQAIALKPDYKAHHNMGVAYARMKRDPEAVAAFKQAIALKPDCVEAHISMAKAYARMKRYTEAIEAYKQGLTLRPNDASTYVGLGLTYRLMQRYSEAIAALKQAITLKPDSAEAYVLMALTYEQMGRHPDAIAAYQNVIRIEPRGQLVARAAREIERLKRLPK